MRDCLTLLGFLGLALRLESSLFFTNMKTGPSQPRRSCELRHALCRFLGPAFTDQHWQHGRIQQPGITRVWHFDDLIHCVHWLFCQPEVLQGAHVADQVLAWSCWTASKHHRHLLSHDSLHHRVLPCRSAPSAERSIDELVFADICRGPRLEYGLLLCLEPPCISRPSEVCKEDS